MSFKTTMMNVKGSLRQNAPTILVGVGILGLVGTAYLSYKTKPKVDEVLKKYEQIEKEYGKVNKVEFVVDMVKATYLPIVIGAASITCIFGSHFILRNRLVAAQSAFAMVMKENDRIRGAIEKHLPKKDQDKILIPIEKTEVVEENGDVKKVDVLDTTENLGGFWFKTSQLYTKDHDYNSSLIASIKERLYITINNKGVIPMNMLYEEFGLPATRVGSYMGWSASLYIDTQTVITNEYNEETGEVERVPQIYVSWTRPEDVTGSLTYSPASRYSIFGR